MRVICFFEIGNAKLISSDGREKSGHKAQFFSKAYLSLLPNHKDGIKLGPNQSVKGTRPRTVPQSRVLGLCASRNPQVRSKLSFRTPRGLFMAGREGRPNGAPLGNAGGTHNQ
jgi:hypothetical protein